MELTQEQIHARLEKEYPHGITLRYVDYRDSLDDHPDMMKAIIEWNIDYINDQIDSRRDDYDTINFVLNEYFTEEEREQDDLSDIVSDRCRNHNDEDPMDQLIKNSHSPLAYYDTGIEFSNPDYLTAEEMKAECIQACRDLGIHVKNWTKLKSLYNNAYYGWSLILIVNVDLADLYKYANWWPSPKYINFGYTTVGIIDFGNGSWDFEQKLNLCKWELSFTYDPARLVIDATETYGIQSIFWCSRDVWWEVYFSDTRPKGKHTKWRLPHESKAAKRHAEEAKRNKTYRDWWCTPGDMNISRHRDCFYRNDVPCGTKCPHCWTFRVD